MRRLGRVKLVTRSRNFLVQLSGPINRDLKNMVVVDENLRVIGVVRDIIGPVRSPYALVKVLIPLDEAEDYVDRVIYLPSKSELRLLRPPRRANV